MAEKNPKSNLADLLDRVERDHKADIQLYTSGHLNHNKLYKPPKSVKHNYWGSAQKSAIILTKQAQLTASSEVSRKAKHNLTRENDRTSTHIRAKSAAHSCRRLTSKATSGSVAPRGATSVKLQRKEIPPEEEKDEFSIYEKPLIREELDIPEMKMLKYKPMKNSRVCFTKESKDEYKFLPSYLSGVTKTDQYYKFMQFQKEFIDKQDLLENDYIGSKSVQQHEKKLTQALQNICDCKRPHFNRLQAVGDVFEDICNSSLIFGDILKEVKNEYELYIVILLDSLPSMQYRTLQNQVKGMEKRTVLTHEIEENRNVVQILVQKIKLALTRNEELRNELEMELWVSQSESQVSEKEIDDAEKATGPLSSAEQLISLRCQIIMKWEEIQEMEKEIKNTMTFAGIVSIREKTVKELEAEASKLHASNKFLRKHIKDTESSIKDMLKTLKFTTENQRNLWELVKDFLTPEGKEDPSEYLESSYSDISLQRS